MEFRPGFFSHILRGEIGPHITMRDIIVIVTFARTPVFIPGRAGPGASDWLTKTRRSISPPKDRKLKVKGESCGKGALQ